MFPTNPLRHRTSCHRMSHATDVESRAWVVCPALFHHSIIFVCHRPFFSFKFFVPMTVSTMSVCEDMWRAQYTLRHNQHGNTTTLSQQRIVPDQLFPNTKHKSNTFLAQQTSEIESVWRQHLDVCTVTVASRASPIASRHRSKNNEQLFGLKAQWFAQRVSSVISTLTRQTNIVTMWCTNVSPAECLFVTTIQGY